MTLRIVRSIWFWTPWELLLGALLAYFVLWLILPGVYNACTHKLDVNPTHHCVLVVKR